MDIEEIINAKIAEMGHIHEVTADRSVTPVLYTPAAEEGADVWELWLKGTSHPDWQIIHRRLTKEEAEAIRADVPRGLNVHPDFPCDFYVRDGRKAGWTRSMVVKPNGPKRALHPGDGVSFSDSTCPYRAQSECVKYFVDDPRTHVDVVRHLEAAIGEVKEVWGVKVNGSPIETD